VIRASFDETLRNQPISTRRGDTKRRLHPLETCRKNTARLSMGYGRAK
jgi:hypothetical protein